MSWTEGRTIRERSPVEAQLYQWTKHHVDVSPETVARVVAGELVEPDSVCGPVFDVVYPPKDVADLW